MEKHQTKRTDLAKATQPVARKPYKKPVLEVYGDIVELTQTTNTGPKDDLARTGSGGAHAPFRPK
jgi:hypothetical protein